MFASLPSAAGFLPTDLPRHGQSLSQCIYLFPIFQPQITRMTQIFISFLTDKKDKIRVIRVICG